MSAFATSFQPLRQSYNSRSGISISASASTLRSTIESLNSIFCITFPGDASIFRPLNHSLNSRVIASLTASVSALTHQSLLVPCEPQRTCHHRIYGTYVSNSPSQKIATDKAFCKALRKVYVSVHPICAPFAEI